MKTNRYLIGLFAIATVLFSVTAFAQTTNTALFSTEVGKAITDNAKAFIATNDVSLIHDLNVVPYVSYQLNNKNVGGGVFVSYKITGSTNQNLQVGIGLDYANGGFWMPSGTVEGTKTYHYFGRDETILALAGIATPIAGAGGDNFGLAALAGAGAKIQLATVNIGGKAVDIVLGGAYVRWLNAGVNSGNHVYAFAGFDVKL